MNKIEKQLLDEVMSLKSREGYFMAGFPKFLGLFGRDSIISAWQFLNYNPSIARDTLLALSKLEGKKTDMETGEEVGKILHEYYSKNTPDSWWRKYKSKVTWLKRGSPVYFSVDSTPLFLILLAFYFGKTGDKEFLRKIWVPAMEAINWILAHQSKEEFLFYKKIKDSKKGLIIQGWIDGKGSFLEKLDGLISIVDVQGWVFLAFSEMKRLAVILGERNIEERLNKDIKELKNSFNKKFWMDDKKFYCLALNEKGERVKTITSNPGHLLFSGIINDKKKELAVVEKLFSKEMWTSYGIRTQSTKEPDFDSLSYQKGAVWPHDNWIIAQGLQKLGYKREYLKVKNAILNAYNELGYVPEYYGVSLSGKLLVKELKTKPCYPQAWASGALFNFLEEDE